MYEKECKWCKELIIVEKQPNFASHVACCKMNPNFEKNKLKSSKLNKGIEKVERLIIKRNCLRCENEFEIRATESEIKNDQKNPKLKKYCTDKCARVRTISQETKDRIRKSLLENGNMYVPEKRERKIYKFTCLKCNITDNCDRSNKKYHKECWLSVSGGIKKGSSRGRFI